MFQSTTLVCLDCACSFERSHKDGPVPKRCPKCSKTRQHVRHSTWQRQRAAEKAKNSAPILDICIDCGSSFPRVHPKGVRRRCVSCRVRHEKIRYKLYQPNRDRSPKLCETCGIVIIPKSVGPVPRWCRPCAIVIQKKQRDNWLKAQPELQREQWQAHKQRRRAAKRNTEVEYFRPIDIYLRDKWRCGICRKFVDRDLKYPHPESPSLDHIIPLSKGGTHTRDNVQLAHLQCNCLKQDRS